MENITIRLCRKGEVVALAAYAKILFHEAFADQNDPVHFEKYTSEAFSHKAFQQLFDNPDVDFYITQYRGQQIGYMQINQGKAQTESDLKNALEVQRIYLSSDYQKKGVGKAMIDYAKCLAKELSMEWLWLGVWEHNTRAISFYKREGFEVFSSHVFMVGDDPQTDIMLKWKVIG